MPTSKTRKTKKDQKTAVVSASDWKKKSGGAAISNVTLPSGVTVKVKRISITTLLTKGVFPDSLAAIVQEKLDGDKNTKPKDQDKPAAPGSDDQGLSSDEVKGLMDDPEKLNDLFESIDKIVMLTVIEPVVLPVVDEDGEEIDEEDRDEEQIYIDEIDINDKVFLFQYSVGGTKDLEPFRAELNSALAGVEDVQGVQNSSQ